MEFPEPINPNEIPERNFALTGCVNRAPRKAEPKNSAEDLEKHNIVLQEKYSQAARTEKRSESIMTEDAQIVVVAFGFVSRIAHEMVARLREEGRRVGLFRPVTLWPFDEEGLAEATKNAKSVVVLEGNAGMMCNDIRMYLGKKKPVYFHGRMGGSIINSLTVKEKIIGLLEEKNDWRELDGKQGLWKAF